MQRMVSFTKQQRNEIWKTVRNGLMSFPCVPVLHRTPCFQRDFGKRTRPLNLPRALSTENACCCTWRSKRLSTRTEKTLYRLRGKRKVPSVAVWALGKGLAELRTHRCPPFLCWAGVAGLGLRRVGSGVTFQSCRSRSCRVLCPATLPLSSRLNQAWCGHGNA